jgi:hypothetical protein
MTHDQLQAECWTMAWNHCVKNAPHMLRRFFSVPNSAVGFLGRKKAKQLQSCGLLAGVWDMPVYDDVGATHWIEFKVGSDQVSDDQKKFMTAMLPLGNQFFYEVRDTEQFFTIFTAIVNRNVEILKRLEYK